MKILVVHTWLRGNLGDVLQASVLMRSLRELRPTRLDLGGFPARPGVASMELVELADRHVPEPFTWYWRYTPAAARARIIEPNWRRQRTRLFSQYDVVVSAPGPFIADYDLRLLSALSDIRIAEEAGVPLILSSHSIGPLSASAALDTLRRVTLCVARESATHEYLRERGVPSVLSADYAFLYPYKERLEGLKGPKNTLRPGYRLVFLRSNNLKQRDVRFEGRALISGSHRVVLEPGERVVLSSSDMTRDGRFLARLARSLGVEYVPCHFVSELISMVAGSTGVVTDRYHPAICATVLGKPAEVIINHEPHKMHGLKDLMQKHELTKLQTLSRTGLTGVREAILGTRAGRQRLESA